MIRRTVKPTGRSVYLGNNIMCDLSIGQGEKGEKGDSFEFEDFTPEQLELLRGERGEKGESFKFEDFTPEQLELLKGEKGENAEFRKTDTHIQYRIIGESEWIDLVPLDELKVKQEIIDDLLVQVQELSDRLSILEDSEVKPPSESEIPTFLGIITPFKNISDITYEDLNVDTVVKNIVSKPQSVYAHSSGTQFNRSCIIAIPKSYGNIVGVVDGANISITGSYHWANTTINIPNVGNVEYIIGGNIKAQAYNNASVVKWNLV